MEKYRRFIKQQIKRLQAIEREELDYQAAVDAAATLREARRMATSIGLADVAKLLLCHSEAVAPVAAQGYLSAALATLPSDNHLSVPQVANRYGVSAETVRGWIATGALQATTTSKKRPRWRITEAALTAFDARTPAPSNKRRPKRTTRVSRY